MYIAYAKYARRPQTKGADNLEMYERTLIGDGTVCHVTGLAYLYRVCILEN